MVKKEKEMSFLGHLEELRWHLVRSASVVLIFGILDKSTTGFSFCLNPV